MDKSLISQVNLKEDFILFKNCFIDLGKIAFVEERQRPYYLSDKYGHETEEATHACSLLKLYFMGTVNTLAFRTQKDLDEQVSTFKDWGLTLNSILLDESEYDTLKAFLMNRLKPEQVR